MDNAHSTTRAVLAASIFVATVALARESTAQSLPPFPHAVAPTDDANEVSFQVAGGPHSITVLPRGAEWDGGAHAVDCNADCTFRLAPGRYALIVARTPSGPSYTRRILIRPDSMRVEASSPNSMTLSYVLDGAAVVAGLAAIGLLIGYAGAYPWAYGPSTVVPSALPDVRILDAGLGLLATGIALGLTGVAVGVALRPRVRVVGGARAGAVQFGASPLAGGGFVGMAGVRL